MRDVSILHFFSGSFLWGLLLFTGTTCLGAETWMPDTRHLQAFEQGETCSIYETLQGRAQRKLVDVVAERDQYDSLLKRRRALLEACAKNAGVVSFVSARDEVRLAQACSEDYSAWMNLGFRMRVVREDLRSIKASLKWLNQRTVQCGRPRASQRTVAVTPTSLETPPTQYRAQVREAKVEVEAIEQAAPVVSDSQPLSAVPVSRRAIPE